MEQKASGGPGKCRAVVNCLWLAAISLSIHSVPPQSSEVPQYGEPMLRDDVQSSTEAPF